MAYPPSQVNDVEPNYWAWGRDREGRRDIKEPKEECEKKEKKKKKGWGERKRKEKQK